MTVVTSTVPAVADAFVELVANLAEFVDIQVQYGPPGGTVETSSLWVDSASPMEQGVPAAPGWVARSEKYDLNGNLWVLAPGMSAVESRDRAFELLAAVETAMRGQAADNGQAAMRLGIDAVMLVYLTVRGSHPFISDEGYGHHIEFALVVSAWLGTE